MTDNIDHAAEALRLIASGKERGHPSDSDSPIAEAQMHATLALVAATEKVAEQQRIANVIALSKYWGDATQMQALRNMMVEQEGKTDER